MKKSNISLLNSFSKKEIKAFSRFVESSYFNTDKNILQLWHLLKKHIIHKRDFNEQWEAKIYDEIYKQKKTAKKSLSIKEKNIFNAKLSVLIALARRFLVIEALDSKKAINNEILNEELSKKKQLDMSYRYIAKERKILQLQELKDIDYYQYAYAVENSWLNCLYQKRLLVKEDNIDEINFHLDMQYILRKLSIQGTALSLTRVSDTKDFDFSSIEAIQSLIALPQYASQALIILQSVVLELMQTDKEESYFRLLELLVVYQSDITTKNLYDFYTVANNFCIRKIHKKELQYNRYLYELYKTMNEKNLLTQDNLISVQRLKTIVILSCRMKDFSWAKELVNKYQAVIRHKDKQSVCHFNLGVIAFYEAKHNAAISHFIRVKKVNNEYDIDVRMMLAKAHYELDQEYDERTMTIFRSTERFVNNHKTISNDHKKRTKNFIKILIKIYNLRFQIGKITLEKIISEINKTESNSDTQWLIDKLEGLS